MRRASHPAVLLVLPVILLGGCGGPERPALAPLPAMTAKSWIDLGDAALGADPGRALADYEKAKGAAQRTPELDRAISEKTRDAADRWLRAEIATAKARLEADPRAAIAWAEATRLVARRYEIEGLVGPDLAEITERAKASLYGASRAELTKPGASPLEEIAALAALEATVPEAQAEERERVKAEVARRRAAQVARFEAAALSAAASNRAGAALVEGRLAAMARAVPSDPAKVPAPPALASAVSMSWDGKGTGCDGLASRLVSELPKGGALRGALRLELTCEVSAPVKEVTEKKETSTRKRTEKKTTYQEKCVTKDYGGTKTCTSRGTNGQCQSWSGGTREECSQVPVTKTVEVEVPVTTVQKLETTKVSARARGSLVIEASGKSATLPIDVTASVTNRAAKEGARAEAPSKEQAQAAVVNGPVQGLVKKTLAELDATLMKTLLSVAEEKLAQGDEDGAEDALGIAIASGIGASAVPRAFEKLARRDGLSLEQWTAAVVDQRSPLRAPAALQLGSLGAAVRGPEAPGPDREGLAREAAVVEREASIQKATRARDRSSGEVRVDHAREDDTHVTWGLGLTHWDTYGGQAGAGPTLSLALRGGGGAGVPFYAYEGVAGLESSFGGGTGGGLDALARLGGGLRFGRFGLVLHGVGGGSGRGTSESALYVPMGLDAGVGARLLLRVGDETSLQLLGERIWRPLREQGDLDRPVVQRLRYEARLVFRDGEETAVSASCSFHQRATTDVAFPETDILGRSCDASLFMPF